MSAVGTSSDSGALSVSQAISELNEADAAAAPDASETGTDDSGMGADDAPAEETQDATTSDDGSEAEQPGDAETTEEDASGTLKLEPPRWWSKEKKDRFNELPPDLQAVVFEQEETRERVVSKVKQESADARKAADDKTALLTRQLAVIEPLLQRAQTTFADRWADVDWPTVARQVDAAKYNELRAEFENEQTMVGQLQAAHTIAARTQLAEFVKAEEVKLKTVAPELVDEKLGPQRRAEVGKFLSTQGFANDRLSQISAAELSIAYDAMLYRQAKAKTAAALKQPKTPAQQQQTRPAVRPSAAPGAGSPVNARVKQLESAFEKNPSAKNLEALMNAQKG